MQAADFKALLPFLMIAGTSIVVMVVIAFYRNHRLTLWLTLSGLAAAFFSLFASQEVTPRQVTPLLLVDRYALFYTGLIITATFTVALLAYVYLAQQEENREEFYILLLIAAFGAAVLTASSHFASFFLGLETLSVSLFPMNAYLQKRKRPLEAGIKYLILAALSGVFLLFGMALLYADLGTMAFGQITLRLAENRDLHSALLFPGAALILVGIGFKLAWAPFHLWTPDVYEGAPAPVTAFIATVSKGGVFSVLLRIFNSQTPYSSSIMQVLGFIALISMITGTFLALLQNNVKRILAYSSIAHMGFLLVAFLAAGRLAVETVTFYWIVYFVSILGAFGVVSLLSGQDRDADRLQDYRGLFWRRPLPAGIFAAMLLSLAGLPMTAGFMGKFYIVAAGVSSALWGLTLTLIITSGIGIFYYLRLTMTLFAGMSEAQTPGPDFLALPWIGNALLIVLVILLIWLGIYPAPFIRMVQTFVIGL